MIRVQIVEKQYLIRKLLSDYLGRKNSIEIVGESDTPDKTLAMAIELAPDIILLDTNITNGDVLEISEKIHKAGPSIGIVVFSSLRYDILSDRLQKQGVKGLVSTNDNPEELVEAIEAVHRDEVYMSRTVAQNLALAASPSGDDKLPVRLTEREKEILIMLSRGKSVQEVADTLYLSPKTVFSHRKRIFEKTGSENLVDLVFWSLRHNLLHIN